jgi:hypothetical protein
MMEAAEYLAFSVDGSTDSKHRGVNNLSIVDGDNGSYILKTEVIEGTDESALATARELKTKLLDITGKDLRRISSIAFDTLRLNLLSSKSFKMMTISDILSLSSAMPTVSTFSSKTYSNTHGFSNVHHKASTLASEFSAKKQMFCYFSSSINQ